MGQGFEDHDLEDGTFTYAEKSFNVRNIDWKSKKTLGVIGAIVACLLITLVVVFGVGWFFTRDEGETPSPSSSPSSTPLPAVSPASTPSFTPAPAPSIKPNPSPSATPAPSPSSPADAATRSFWEEVVAPGVLSSIDSTADPCQDFYQYACGNWVANFQLPADKTGYTKSFNSINDNVEVILRSILEADWPLIGPYYASCLDVTSIDELGTTPLLQLIDNIMYSDLTTAPLSDPDSDLPYTLATISSYGFGSLFETYVQPDSTNPYINLLTVDQGGLGMPTPDYYLNSDSYTLGVQTEYKNHIGILFGITYPEKTQTQLDDIVQRIFAFETKIANFSLSRADHRNPILTYNKQSTDDLKALSPAFNWDSFFLHIGLPVQVDEVNVAVPKFFEGINDLLSTSSADTIRDYATWLIIQNSAVFLSTPYLNEIQRYSSILTGRQQAPPRWKLCMSLTGSVFGELLGRYFVQEAFDEESKAKSQDLIDMIKTAFAARIPTIDWMDEETKQAALVKLNAVNNKIGYPDKWNDYSGITVYEGSFLLNALIGYGHAFSENINDAGSPVDRSVWYMDPQDVNAYYDPLMNEMAFPAAILQPPFYHKNYPDALNFGAIGAVMGHELTHGFDDEGRQFDAHGFLHQWWTDESVQNFEDRAQCVIDAYTNFPLDYPGNINGEQTLGENLADMGGVKDAYEAFQLVRARNPDKSLYDLVPEVFGLTNEQLFFVSYGQVWCTVMKEEQEILRLSTDVHSPSKARVDMPLTNTDYFSDAFQCKKDTPMNPPTKCNVW